MFQQADADSAARPLRRQFSFGSLMHTLAHFGDSNMSKERVRKDPLSGGASEAVGDERAAESGDSSSSFAEADDDVAKVVSGGARQRGGSHAEKEKMSFLLFFKDPDLEKAFVTFDYGRKRFSVYLGVANALAVLLFLGMLLTEDIGMISFELYLPRIFCAMYFGLVALLTLIPTGFVRLIALLELAMVVGALFAGMQTLVRDVLVMGLDASKGSSPSLERPIGFVYIFVGIATLTQVRLFIFLVFALVFAVASTAFLLWYYFANQGVVDIWLWISQCGVFFLVAIMTVSLVYVLQRSKRLLFLAKGQLEEKVAAVGLRTDTSRGLLENILPLHFVQKVEKGDLRKDSLASIKAARVGVLGEEKRKTDDEGEAQRESDEFDPLLLQKLGCLVETVSDGAVIEADLVGFTAWSLHCSSERVVRTVNEYIDHFDRLAELLDIEKVRTIGDAWLGFVRSSSSYENLVCFGVTLIAGTRMVNEAESKRENQPEEEGRPRSAEDASAATNLSLRVGIAGGTLHLAVQGSLETAIVFDIVGHLAEEATALEGAAEPDSLRMNFAVASSCEVGFTVNWLEEKGKVEVVEVIDEDEPGEEGEGELEEVDLESLSKRFDGTGVISVPAVWRDVVTSDEIAERIVGVLDRCGDANLRGEKKKERKGLAGALAEIPTKKRLKCVSDFGLIYPLVCFRSMKDELAAQREYYDEGGAGLTSFFFALPVIFSFLLLLLYGSERDWTSFLKFNAFLTVIYLNIAVDVALVLFFVISRIVKFQPPIYVYWCCIGVHTVFFLSEAIMASVDGFHGLFLLAHVSLLVVDSGLLSVMKWVIVFFHTIFFLVDWWGINYPGNFEQAIARIPVIGGCLVIFVLGSMKKDLSVKLSYENRARIAVKMDELEEERVRNERLLNCVLPPAIVGLLYKLRGRTFISSMDQLFVCAAKCDHVSPVVDRDSEERRVRSVAAFSTLLQTEFASAIALDGRCMRIKTFLSSFIFISRKSGLEGLVASLENVEGWRAAFQKCVREYSSWKDDDFDVRSVRLRFGLAAGDFHSGIFGRNRFSFDILGVPVNLASRLAATSDHLKTTVSDQNLNRALDEDERIKAFESFVGVVPRRSIALKGFGEVDCSFLSLSKEVVSMGREEE